jgi:hypothetical protein
MIQINLKYDDIKEWLPQTTEKLAQYLKSTDEDLILNEAEWILCIKGENQKGDFALQRIFKHQIKQNVYDIREIDYKTFKELIKEEHLETYVRVQNHKYVCRSKKLNYTSYKNQQLSKQLPQEKNESREKVMEKIEVKNEKPYPLWLLEKNSYRHQYYLQEYKVFHAFRDVEKNVIKFIVADSEADLKEGLLQLYVFDYSTSTLSYKFIISQKLNEFLTNASFDEKIEFEGHPIVKLRQAEFKKELGVHPFFYTDKTVDYPEKIDFSHFQKEKFKESTFKLGNDMY